MGGDVTAKISRKERVIIKETQEKIGGTEHLRP